MAHEELLRSEIAELRAREERYREGLDRQLDLSRRLREYAAHLRASLRDQPLRAPAEVFDEVAQVSAGALGVGRVSVWLLDRLGGVFRCHHLFVDGRAQPPSPTVPIEQILDYLRAVTVDVLAVEDVTAEPRLHEVLRYCQWHEIGARLDVPIVIEGELLGVICHEHVGAPRRWHDAEVDFAANLGSVVALALEAERRFEAERRYRQLVERSDLLGVVLDRRGAIVSANEAFAATVGVARSELIGADFISRFVPEDERARVRAAFRATIQQHALPARFELALVTHGGALRSVVWTNTLLFDGAGAVMGTASLGLDLTERLRLEVELAQQRKFESLGRMAASVAHDFNNVLAVVSLAQARGGKGAEIDAAMGYAKELVASLMAFARREPAAVVEVDVDGLIEELEPMLATAIGKELRLEVARRAAGHRVRIAPTELRQLVVNMVTNAGEATRGHGTGVWLTSGVLPGDGARGPRLELQIADDGRGMDAPTIARAFDPFFTTKPAGEGTGIGLATCQAIAVRADGSITVESKPDIGTTFRITFPALAATAAAPPPAARGAAPAATAAADPPATAAAAGERRVLLVEDSPALGELISYMLGEAGYEVLHAQTVAQAIEALGGASFGVLITDLQMPDGHGEDVIEAARARNAHTAIIVASGHASVINGVDGLLMKPFLLEELKRELARAIAHRRSVMAEATAGQ